MLSQNNIEDYSKDHEQLVGGRAGEPSIPDPEVKEKKGRRFFSVEYKVRIVKEAQACTKPGEIGALLRREGLYSSQLGEWRKQYQQGQRPKKRGRKESLPNPLAPRVCQLEKENQELQRRLKQAEAIIEAQKKICAIFELPALQLT